MTNVLSIMAALPQLIKAIAELMRLAEEAFGAGKGGEKKQSVLEAIQAMIDNLELWGKVQALFSSIINMMAFFNFGSTGKEPVK